MLTSSNFSGFGTRIAVALISDMIDAWVELLVLVNSSRRTVGQRTLIHSYLGSDIGMITLAETKD